MAERNVVRSCLAVLLLLPAAFPTAAAERAAVKAMMAESGIVAEYSELDENFRSGLMQGGGADAALSAEHLRALGDIGYTAMDDRRLLAELEVALADGLTDAQVQTVREFYTSPLGGRLKKAEVSSANAAVSSEIAANQDALRAELERDPQRLALARRFDEVTFASKITASLATTMAHAMASGMLAIHQPGLKLEDLPEAREQLSAMQKTVESDLRIFVLAYFHETYRDISTQDLRSYAAFQETEDAKAAYAAILAALDVIFAARGEEIGREFASYLKQKPT